MPACRYRARWTSISGLGPFREAADTLGGDVVLKPAWGGDGVGVQRATRTAERTIATVRSELPGRPMLMQPYLPEISDGEWSLIFVAGEFCHAALKHPSDGDFRANSRFGARRYREAAPKVAVDVAARILSFIKATPLYARVDGVMVRNSFLCTEVELTDPNLYLDLAPETAGRLAAATIEMTT